MPKTNVIAKAVAIAQKSLLACYTKDGVRAGLTHFNEYWVRDGLWTVLGVLRINDQEMAKRQIELFLGHTTMDGEVPLRLTSKFGNLRRILGLPNIGKARPFFGLNPAYFWATGKKGQSYRAKDGGSLLAIAVSDYLRHTKDLTKVKTWWPRLKKVISWYDQHRTDDLIIEDWHEGWTDSLRLKGATLYTNVLYLRALDCMGKMGKSLEKNGETWRRQYRQTRSSLLKSFFNGHYLNNIAAPAPKTPQPFVVDGNMLAVWWNIVPGKMAQSILSQFLKSDVHHPVPCRVNTPKFHKNLVPKRFGLIGLSGYHNDDCAWLWLGAVSVLALKKYYARKAKSLLEKIAKLIVKHKEVYEIYNEKGDPFNTWFYKSEHPFAWNSALFLAAASELSYIKSTTQRA